MAYTTAALITQYEAELANIHAAMLEIEKRQKIAEQQGGRDIAYNPMRALEPPEAKLKRVFNDAVAQCECHCRTPPPPGAKAPGSRYKGSLPSQRQGGEPSLPDLIG